MSAAPFAGTFATVSKEKLIVFVKAPRPGEVKTRLAKTLGNTRACEAYRTLVAAVLKNISALNGVELRFAPDDARDEIAPWLRSDWTAAPQGEGDLGERLRRASAEAFAAGAGRVVMIGSDCPDVRTADARTAWNKLRSHDVVVGPATDGGYWLIGLRAPGPELFEEIAWSSDQVLGQTFQRARTAGLSIHLLRILEDVDTEQDWKRFNAGG